MPSSIYPEDRAGYATYQDYDEFSYQAIKYMMKYNETIWKLLKYTVPDAWNLSKLSQSEKASLIYNGGEDGTLYRVFLDDGLPDVQTREDCIVRISPYSIKPENRTVGTLYMRMEVYSHWKINHLSNYKTRVDMITNQMLNLFNGAIIGGIGRLHFNALQSAASQARMETSGQIPFKGKVLFFGNKSN